jgi:hypothetical protein
MPFVLERTRQPLLAGIEELIDQVFLNSDVPRQHERDETIGKLMFRMENEPSRIFR